MSGTNIPTVRGVDEYGSIGKYVEKHGFVVLKSAISDGKLAAVKAEICSILNAEAERHLDTATFDSGRFDAYLKPLFDLGNGYRGRLYDLLQDMHSLYKIGFDDTILSAAQNWGIRAPNLRNIAVRVDIPGEDKFLQPIHQDLNNSWSSIACWIPLQDVTPENGALRVFSNSHELGPIKREHEEHGYKGIHPDRVKNYKEINCSISSGDVLAMHPCLAHRSEKNRSNHIRWTIIVRFNDATEMPWLRKGVDPFNSYR